MQQLSRHIGGRCGLCRIWNSIQQPFASHMVKKVQQNHFMWWRFTQRAHELCRKDGDKQFCCFRQPRCHQDVGIIFSMKRSQRNVASTISQYCGQCTAVLGTGFTAARLRGYLVLASHDSPSRRVYLPGNWSVSLCASGAKQLWLV